MKDLEDRCKAKLATFGAGCFWCVEAAFKQLRGVERAMPGYAGGHVERPTYEEVCSGTTGHAEACQITYDPGQVSYAELLEIFWEIHDPTTRDRQGDDVGTQYRSVIFFHDQEQKRLAELLKSELDAEHIWDCPIVTEIVPLVNFWPAEEYHLNYFDRNPEKAYCSLVIAPKLDKFRKAFGDRLKGK
jgi:peptide-methionine (S)-S-oxide reductase